MIRMGRWFKQLKDLKEDRWENHCHQCGMCCHEKTIVGKDIIYNLDQWCEHYDPETKLCRIYAKRLTEHARCKSVNIYRAMFASYLPPTCGYVEWAQKNHLRFAPYRRIQYVRESSDEDPEINTPLTAQVD